MQLAVERGEPHSGVQPSCESGAAQPSLESESDIKAEHDITLAEIVGSVAKGTKLNRGILLPIATRKALLARVVGTRLVLLRLKERIELRRKKRKREVRNFWLALKYIWWPKITRVFRPIPNIEFFRPSIKHVESHFGTAVASYFVLLRWLFYMNLTILVVWMLFVLIPQFVLEPYLRTQRQPTVPCIYTNDSYECPSAYDTNLHFLALPSCKSPPSDAVTATFCAADHSSRVVALPNGTENSTGCPYSSTEYYLCPAYQPVPVAYLMCTAVVYCISFIMLIISLGRAYVDSTVKFSPFIKANFCHAIFSAWDYKISNARAVKVKKAFIRTELQEELAVYDVQSAKPRNFCKVVLIRIVTNLIVLALMAACGAAIITATKYSWNQLVALNLNAIGLIVPILIIASIIILPIIFHVIAGFEQYETQSGHEIMTLIRSSFFRISTLIVYLVAAYAAIQCTQNKNIQASELNTTYCVNQCWETFIGQQFYNLQILEFLFVTLFTIIYECGRHALYKAFHKRVQHKVLKSILSRASFSISDSFNDLVYYQLLMWLGFFFCPALPAFQVIILFITFFVKKYSLMFNLEPQKDALFRASSTTVVSAVTFLVVLGGSVFPLGYAVSRFRPSVDCGPFRDKATFLSVISEVVDASGTGGKEFLYYVSSSGFIVPLIMVLITLLFISFAVIIAKKKLLRLTIAHLDAEGLSLINIDESTLPLLVELRHQSSAAQEANLDCSEF
ncbi:hypothetical protein EMCRGX_G023134 [Ephydatia muelleri]